MLLSYGMCNAGRTSIAPMSIRDKGGGLASKLGNKSRLVRGCDDVKAATSMSAGNDVQFGTMLVAAINKANGGEVSNLDALMKVTAGVPVSSHFENVKPGKSSKKKVIGAQEDARRKQRSKEEQSKSISNQMVEDEKPEKKKKLEPLGLTINETKANGHCLYSAIQDQLAHLFGGSSLYSYQGLREMVTVYMCHVPEVPSFLPNNQVDGDYEDSLVERIENYCKEVESSEAWGGHLEVGALTHCLKKCLSICSGPFPDIDNVNGIIGPAHYMGQQLDETTNKWSWCKQELREKYMFVTIDNLCIALVLKCCPIGIVEGPETWFLDVMNGNLDKMASEMNKLQLYIGVVHQGIKLFSVQGLGSLLGDSMRNFYLVLC
ncbi:putative ubiquitinyl hydrolase 1 [Rosa chinensis]|uniref:Putative ubiquitinyl hydrolase 1 n=1 Tax=Rosa chinensis TaxID=74649 RepID=A0A2P6Q243_ROSCH|nr:putative ubiquitinyl hydrolase 1 [Rosa chinensis]